MQIRDATTTDAAAVGRVHAASRRAAYVDLVPAAALDRITPDSQSTFWRARLAAATERSALLVVEDDLQVQGFAQGEASGDVAELNALHLMPDRQGSGAGQALHDALLARFAGWGCAQAELCVLRGNERAQAFYRRNGWVQDGTTGEHDVGGAVVPILRYRRAVTSATTRR